MTKPVNLLFICSRNQWRSPTAETVWKNDPRFYVRSAGTSPRARRTVNPADIRWADVIFVMEKKHKNRLQAAFGRLLEYKPVYVLDIPDEYHYMDPELILELEDRVNHLLSKDT
ncbi:phosphotyrosine protein phosphatase [Zooshikella marina]|uniref:low molecular weight protein tyrosine phosphatase family protein n=1 Tax=Zooshikella ganghwensis TaxID=202772 RepID=UPI00048406B6|nr:phosphotyrosine protein phosphatase [Zooshikella ganghwensis]MBU2707131.1 phosphotyrosine protein phosphatase [Zooshikella ganghwensis]